MYTVCMLHFCLLMITDKKWHPANSLENGKGESQQTNMLFHYQQKIFTHICLLMITDKKWHPAKAVEKKGKEESQQTNMSFQKGIHTVYIEPCYIVIHIQNVMFFKNIN